MRLRNGEYNLLISELSGAWEEIILENIEISDYDVTIEDNAITVDGSDVSSSTNIGVGGGASAPGDYVKPADLKAALEPIKDWFTIRTLADGKKVLHSKYGIATDEEISIGGISEDIEDDDSGSFSRLDSWDDYNPANGDVLSAVLGYGLKTDIQSLQEQIDNMGGGGLSSITVKIGNTAYDSVDGVVSLPSYPVVPTLLSEFTDDVVAGHYLPIEGGYFANSLNYKSTSVYPLILGSTASAEQSVILLRHNDVDKAQVGWSSSLGTYLYNAESKDKLGINNNGVAYFNDYTLYHTGNFNPADYLPKSGGVITSASYQPFILHRTMGDDAAPFIVFENDDKRLGTLGISAVTAEPVFYRDSSTRNPFTILHSGNYSDYALPKSGGTLSSDGDTPLAVDSTTTSTYIQFLRNGASVGYFGYVGNEPYTFKGGFQKIIHAGNIGSQSVAKARSLYDFGVISTAFNANTSLSGGGKQSNYDNIALWGDSVPSGMQYGMIYQLQGYYQDGNALAGQLAWDVNHLGEDSTRNLWWRANDSTAFANAKWHQIAFTDSNVASANKIITSGRANNINISDVVSCKYLIASAGVANGPWVTQGVKILHFAWDSEVFASQLAIGVQAGYEDATNPANYRLAWRAQKNAIWGDWKYVAFTDSNVASATKLETARTIWGHSFDGTGNITGPLTIANNVGGLNIQDTSGIGRTLLELNSSNNIVFGRGISSLGYNVYYYANNHLFWYGKNAGEAMRINGNGNVLIGTITDDANSGKLQVSIGATVSGYASTGTVASIADLAGKGLTIATGSIRTNWGMAMWVEGNGHGYIQQQNFGDDSPYSLCLNPFGGNIGIGTTTPVYKLDVSGTGRFTNSVTIGEATLSWDATYNCLRVNTNLATDGELTVGGVSDAAVVTEYDSAAEIAELNRRITELENRLAAYEQ